ncbi:MAG: hypothetical protein NTV72_01085 [Candidatus Taylorbacteria bacterium]|nr:hypothetical protein [Candidatus Taylorbacteria bacterium]
MPPVQNDQILTVQNPIELKHHWKIILSVLVLIVLLIAGAVFAQIYGLINLPFLSSAPYNSSNFLNGIVAASQKVEKSKYSVTLGIHDEKRDSSTIPVYGMANSLSEVPPDMSIDLSVSGGTDKKDAKNADFFAKLDSTINLSFMSMQFKMSGELRKLGDTFYAIANDYPIFFASNIYPIKSKWINFTKSDLDDFGLGSYMANNIYGSLDAAKQAEVENKMKDIVFKAISIAEKDNALEISSAVKDTVNGETAYRYDLKPNKSNIIQFYKDFYVETKRDLNLINEDNYKSQLSYLESKDFTDLVNFLRVNGDLSIWVNKDGIPVKYVYGVRLMPEGDIPSWKDKELRASITAELKDINQPIVVEIPKDSITFDEANSLVTGMSKDEIKIERQSLKIRNLKYSIENYNYSHNAYPTSLTDLPNTKQIPNDVFTNLPIQYSNNGKDFTIKYTMQFPSNLSEPARNILYYSTFDYSGKYSAKVYKMVYVNGLNTATMLSSSLEADLANKIDSDKDGVPDALEIIMGMNKNKKDAEKLSVVKAISPLSASINPLDSARAKGQAARVFSDIQQIRVALESEFDGIKYPSLGIYNANNKVISDFSNIENITIQTLVDDVQTYGGKVIIGKHSLKNGAGSDEYSVYGSFSTGGYLCVDSTGVSKKLESGIIPDISKADNPASCQ